MTPASEAELSGAIRSAEGPLRIVGGGTRPIGKPVDGAALSTDALTGLELYEPGALTLVVKAGTPVEVVKAALAAEGQRLPFEPIDHRALLGTTGAATMGGMVAANASGPRRIAVGACRDFLLGVRFVDGAGRIVKNGGRVMKNVTGYDLVKLMAGSHGTLGVLTEVALKVLPDVDDAATLTLTDLADTDAVRAMSAALGSPFEVTGAAHDPEAGRTRLRIEGFENSVTYRAGRLRDLLASFGTADVAQGKVATGETWSAIRDVTDFAGRAGDVWRLSVKPSDAAALVARSGAETVRYDLGGGLVWLLMPEGADLRAKLGTYQGHATLVRASKDTRSALPVFQPENTVIAKISSDLRARFDPRGILNPGVMA
ncbi:MAG: FAD-binding protein [Alphaproteobacteria bacterium]|jgi:glycolate oxidase FAD binding subunit|nr:FAD-binding protein [Alphaproteobacteria bacterium]